MPRSQELQDFDAQTDRRQSSPEYRERVHKLAEAMVSQCHDDYDAALERVEHLEQCRPTPTGSAVISLLRRRAETVKGMR